MGHPAQLNGRWLDLFFLGHQNRLPYQVQNWLGLKDDVGKFKDMFVSDEDLRYVSLMDATTNI